VKPNLWSEIQKNNSDAMKTLYQSCYQDLYSFGYRVTSDKEKVKDAIHEVFCEIWQNRSKLKDVNNITAYLKTYLKRKLLKDLVPERQYLDINEYQFESLLNVHSYEYLLIESQTTAQQKEKIYNAINQLTPSQKEIIDLKFYQGLSYDQIALLLNLQARTIYNHVYAALVTLKKLLK
jgi:RNA polymerase sigma factor (sigma-70 family)